MAKEKGTIQNGVIDLHNYDWKKQGSVSLTGNWEFYWNQFYAPAFFKETPQNFEKKYAFVPSFWNGYNKYNGDTDNGFGYATYRLLVICPNNNELALKFLTVESAYRLYVNGKKILEVGHAAATAGETIAELKPLTVYVTPENNKLDIVIQVSNFHNHLGGLWDVVTLGTKQQISSLFLSNISLEFFIAGCFFIAAVYYFILFISFRRMYTLLFFAILCLIIFTRSMVTGEMPVLYISDINWAFARRTEYISFYLSVPVMALFSYHLFPKDFSKKVLNTLLLACSFFVVLGLFGSYYIYTYVVRYYQVVMLLATFFALYVYIKAAINKRPGSLLFLIGFCIFITTIINDILYVNLVINSIPLFYLGLFYFIISLAILLSKQFSGTFYELGVVNNKLLLFNKQLDGMNNEMAEKNTELEKMNYELDLFVNRTSHDLKGPLTSLLGIVYVVKKNNDPVKMNELLLKQEKILKRMNTLINDIIEFSKNKRLELELKEIDFFLLTDEALEDNSFINIDKNIKKNVEINQHESFISDERRIKIILHNLISNALKYTDDTKEHPQVTIKISVLNNSASIEVADNGIGIEEHHLDKIFTLYYRATNTNKGSGLGLHIVKETVEKLNGIIEVVSKKGAGTKFTIIIPDNE